MWRTVLQFTILSFGLHIEPRVFTIMTVAQALAQLGVQTLMYLDDWLVQAPDHQQCKAHQDLTLLLVRWRGLFISLAKSCLVSTQTMVWLGMEWDS